MKLLSLAFIFLFSISALAGERKIAQEESYSDQDLSEEFKQLRKQWLSIRTGDELEATLRKPLGQALDVQYFQSRTRLLLPFRGIVWRLRPIFENQQNALRSKSAQVIGVQIVRAALISFKMNLPTQQADALSEFLTLPGAGMGPQDQFKVMSEVQDYLQARLLPLITESIGQVEVVAKAAPKTLVWDNHLGYGSSDESANLERYIGHGPAEIYSTIAGLYRTYHDVLAFCAYNQDYGVRLINDFNLHTAADSSFFVRKNGRLGMTDAERGQLMRHAMSKYHYLEIRSKGRALMLEAFGALKQFVFYAEKVVDTHRERVGQYSPVILRNGDRYGMDIELMKSLLNGVTELKDPVSGMVFKLNVPAFYQDPPTKFESLLATKFDQSSLVVTHQNKKGESFKVRNYAAEKALAWDNEVWKKYVPSAEGQRPDYINEARRIMRAAREVSLMFALPEIIIH